MERVKFKRLGLRIRLPVNWKCICQNVVVNVAD